MIRRAKKSNLRLAVDRAVSEAKKGSIAEHRLVIPAASEVLLERLKLSEEQFKKARLIEAHSLRLQESMAQVSSKEPITIGTARRIIEAFIRDAPEFLRRESHRIPPGERENFNILISNLRQELEKIKQVPDNLLTPISMNFLENAKEINFSKLRVLLGKKKFGMYMRAIRRTNRILAQKGQKS